MAAQKEEVITKEKTDIAAAEAVQTDIRSLIYVVRGQQVMFDSDLAMLYQVETKVLNQAVKRNISRFPDRFRFQLSKEEFVCRWPWLRWPTEITFCIHRTRNIYVIGSFAK